MAKPVNPLHLQLNFAAVQDVALMATDTEAAWIKLIPAGRFKARDGRGPFNAGDAASMQAIIDRSLQYFGCTEISIDYDHQTFTSKATGGTAKASGWIKELEVRADGIWGRAEWTPAARRAIRSGEYRYISPAYSNDKAGNIHVLLNAALVNMPALDLVAVAAAFEHNQPMEPEMDKIALALGLATDASEIAILAAINTMTLDRTKVLTTAGLKAEATTDELVTTLSTALAAATPDPTKFVPIEQVTALQTEVKTLRDTVQGDKAEEAVAKAITDGKLTPALKDWGVTLHKADPKQFEAFVAGAPALTTAQLGDKKVDPAANADGLTEADDKIIAMMGLDRTAYIASRKAELEITTA